MATSSLSAPPRVLTDKQGNQYNVSEIAKLAGQVLTNFDTSGSTGSFFADFSRGTSFSNQAVE